MARLQEIVNKIQYFAKLNFRNAVDIPLLLEAEGLEYDQINKLIAAGVKRVGFTSLEQYLQWENLLLPCQKYYLGQVEGQSLTPLLSNFELVETVKSLVEAREISNLNARVGRVSRLLLQVNVWNDDARYGVLPVEVNSLAMEVALLSGLRLVGLHAYIPDIGNLKMQATAARKAGVMFKLLQQKYRGVEILSINYMDDFRRLIAEGVSEIRIGLKSLR